MLVTFTNPSTTTSVYVSTLYQSLSPGETITTRRSKSDIDNDRGLKLKIESGAILVSYTEESEDLIDTEGYQDDIVYVDPAGDDDNSGSAEAPVLTLSRAFDLISTGKRASTIQLAEGSYTYNRPVSYSGLPLGGLASPIIIQGAMADLLGTLTVDGFTSSPATDLTDSTLTAITQGIAGTITNVSSGVYRITDAGLVGELAGVAAGDMWSIYTANTSGNNGTFTVTAVDNSTGAVTYRNAQGAAPDSNDGNIVSQRSYEGCFIRAVTGVNAGQSRIVREMGEFALGTIPVLAKASMTDNDNFALEDTLGNTRTFEYQVTGGFVASGGMTTIDISAIVDTTAAGVAAATATAINGVLPSVVAVRASASGGNSTVRVRQMIPGSDGNVTITKSGSGTWEAAAAAGFGGGTTISDTRSGVGASTTTFRVNRPWGSNPSNGDTFVIERPSSVINYGSTNNIVQFIGGKLGLNQVKLRNAGATPGNVSLVFADIRLLGQKVEIDANGGGVLFTGDSLINFADNNPSFLFGNRTPNPFFTLPTSLAFGTGVGAGLFMHDATSTNINFPVVFQGFACLRQCGMGVQGACSFFFVDGKRSTFTLSSGAVQINAQSTYFARLLGQTTVSSSGAIMNLNSFLGGNSRVTLSQLEISQSGGDAIRLDLQASALLATIIGTENVGVGIRVVNSSEASVTTSGLTVTGTAGDIKSGLRSARTYTHFTGTSPTNQERDIYGDGSRIATTAGQTLAEARTGTIAAGNAFVDVTFGTGLNGAPVIATLNTVDGTATQVISAVWQGSNVLRVTTNAAATADVTVSALAQHTIL